MVAALAPLSPLGIPSVAGQPVAELTTDTPEYCSHLVDVLRRTERGRPPPTQEVVELSGQGEMMCEHGDARRGVLRLRRAMRKLLGAPPE